LIVTIYGIDVSSYQADINFAEVVREGFTFAIIKATEGDGYVSPSYMSQLAAANTAGLVTASYHFVHAADEAGQLAKIKATVPVSSPLVLDSEVDGNGEYGVTVQLVNDLKAAGYRVPLVYMPQWFWSSIGSPSLSGLPALWASGYPSTSQTTAANIYGSVGGDGASAWGSYGGGTVAVWQFTDQAAVAGHQVDVSAYKGTRDELVTFFNGSGVFMALSDGDQQLMFEKVMAMAEGVGGVNQAGQQFLDEQSQRTALASSVSGLQTAVSALVTDYQNLGGFLVELKAELDAVKAAVTSGVTVPVSGSGASAADVAAAVVAAETAQKVADLAALGFVPKVAS
jgi:lysozyme